MNVTSILRSGTADIAYKDLGGDGPAVVFTHGAGMDHSMFDAQVEALAHQGYRVIVWDLRGHGASTLSDRVRFTATDALEDLGALLEECRLDTPVLVGHSLGGNLVQAFVREQPRRVGALIVLDAAWNAGPLTRLERNALRLAAPSLAAIPARLLPGLMARTSAVTPAAIDRTKEVFTSMPKHRFLDVWRATVSLIDPDPHYRCPVPLALVRGAKDGTGTIASAMPRWAEAEGVVEHVIPEAGHIVTWDAPAETTRVLLGILENLHKDVTERGEPL